ncbi:MAG: HD domain-containing phosphohydrolase [Algisphaera sp.]
MIQEFDQALCALQSAVFGREIYSPDHPQVTSQITRATALINALLTKRSSVSFMAFDDRVIFDDQRLPSGANLASGLIARLRRRGVECVTFEAGLTESELLQWLSHFDKDALNTHEPPAHTDHIQMGYLDGVQVDTEHTDSAKSTEAQAPDQNFFDLDADCSDVGVNLMEPGSAVEQLWGDPGDTTNLEGITALVEDISLSVRGAAGALLPLASLKHHDEYTSVHTINVAMMSTALAQQVGLANNFVHDIAVGAVLHDLGKREISPAILNKAGKLTDAEFNAIKHHPAAGARSLLEMSNVPEIAVLIAYEHHMNLDGSGYPGLGKSKQTPHLCSQIVQIADVYDALRTHRPYRRAMSLDQTAKIMNQGAGTEYDADLLQLFFDHVAARTTFSPKTTTAA